MERDRGRGRGGLAVRAGLGLYAAGIEVVAWAVLAPFQAARSRFGEAANLTERLGRHPPPGAARGRPHLLVHAVSVGEVAVAGVLLDALAEEAPGLSAVITVGNREGRRAAERLREGRPFVTAVAYLPWDRPRAVRRWLAGQGLDAVLVVETELWPGLFSACGSLGLPLFLVNARIYPRDLPRYRLARPVFADLLRRATWIGAQSEHERAAFLSLGAPPEAVEVAGNLKLDARPDDRALPAPWDAVLAGGLPLLVAGSTHPPEERWLLAAAARLGEEHPKLLLAVAPRNPGRAGAVLREARRAGLRAVRWSAPGEMQPFDVLVVDEVGWLPSLYSRAAVAFVGGSLVPKGGQNPVEAAARGVPVVSGPDLRHFEEVARALESAGALGRLPGRSPVEELREAFAARLADPAAAREAGRAGRSAVEALRGAARRTARAVANRLP